MLKLFVGDVTRELSDYANKNAQSTLVTSSNFKKIIQLSKTQNITGHTSFSDIGKIKIDSSPFYELLMAADEIVYYPPAQWSDHSDTFRLHSMQRMTEYYLYDINKLKNNVTGLNLDHYTKDSKYLTLWDTRNTDDPTLWISGCSVSHGVGVENNQRYGQLMADDLNFPVSWLTRGGSSLEWAADQILRSDIRKNDIVVWGLTSEFRATEWTNNTIQNINPYNFEESEKGSIEVLSEENRIYKALTSVNQVENFCTKIGAHLVLFPIITSEILRLHLSANVCYIENPYQIGFIDLGTDNAHPGPDQHKVYANFLTNYIKQRRILQ
jgi:hypothetical protein